MDDNRPARLIRSFRRSVVLVAMLAALAVVTPLALSWGRHHPQDLPWTPLDLARPIGFFTGNKLNDLRDNFPKCAALLDRAGVSYAMVPSVTADDGHCGYAGAVRLTGEGSQRLALLPSSPNMACPIAASLSVWEWEVVQPAAQIWFGQSVKAINHFGTYNCRRIRGAEKGPFRPFSEHAHANAFDVAGFVLADGTQVSVARDWRAGDTKAAFLRDVRKGACRLFSTVLSPEFNAAHRDHFHLDQAKRNALGWPTCR